MGQRLVINVRHYSECIASIYYHWSAYSVSALEEARSVVNCICKSVDCSEHDLKLRLIRMCETNGGGIDGGVGCDEFKHIQSVYPDETFKEHGIDRNFGLIAISERGMSEINGWGESSIDIDLDENLIYNYVFYLHNLQTWKEERIECGYDEDEVNNTTLEDIPELGFNLGCFHFSDLDNVISRMNDVRRLGYYVVRHSEDLFDLIA